MKVDKEPSGDHAGDFWNKPSSVLQETLRAFVDHPDAVALLTRDEMQRQLRELLKDSVGA